MGDYNTEQHGYMVQLAETSIEREHDQKYFPHNIGRDIKHWNTKYTDFAALSLSKDVDSPSQTAASAQNGVA